MNKQTFTVMYQYNYGDPRLTKVKALDRCEAARIVEKRRLGNYVMSVKPGVHTLDSFC